MPYELPGNGLVDRILSAIGRVQGTKVRIYNMIRMVGRGELTADNALHQLIEDYHDLDVLSDDLSAVSDQIAAREIELEGRRDDKKRDN